MAAAGHFAVRVLRIDFDGQGILQSVRGNVRAKKILLRSTASHPLLVRVRHKYSSWAGRV